MLRGGLRLRSLMESLEVLNCFKFTPEERERERDGEGTKDDQRSLK